MRIKVAGCDLGKATALRFSCIAMIRCIFEIKMLRKHLPIDINYNTSWWVKILVIFKQSLPTSGIEFYPGCFLNTPLTHP